MRTRLEEVKDTLPLAEQLLQHGICIKAVNIRLLATDFPEGPV